MPAARFCRAAPAVMILLEKFGQHQPLNRQSVRFAREGIDVSVDIAASGHLSAPHEGVLQSLTAAVRRGFDTVEKLEFAKFTA